MDHSNGRNDRLQGPRLSIRHYVEQRGQGDLVSGHAQLALHADQGRMVG